MIGVGVNNRIQILETKLPILFTVQLKFQRLEATQTIIFSRTCRVFKFTTWQQFVERVVTIETTIRMALEILLSFG